MKKMKLSLMILMATAMFSTPMQSFAKDDLPVITSQAKIDYAGKSKKFAVMIPDVLHFRAAIMTAEEMQITKKKYAFEIIVVGELAKALAEEPGLIADIDKAEKLGVKITVCENALNFFKVPKEKLDKRLKTTQNGWIYMFELKDKNYNTLSI